MKKKLNWIEIQNYYNNNHTWRDVINKYNISNATLCKAKKCGLIIFRTKSEAGVLANKLHPRKHSDETKKKISVSMKKYLSENPDNVPYLLNHYSKGSSYPEIYFNEIFNKYNLDYVKELQIHYYSLDFAFIKQGINVEIDGEQHYLDKRIIISNNERDKYLSKYNWEIIRIRWSHYQKLNNYDKNQFIIKLINHIKNKQIVFNVNEHLNDKKYYCNNCGVKITKYSKSSLCRSCNNKKCRKVDRPNKKQLINDINQLGYSGTGRKYGVSDNAIRKWIKFYNN